MYKISIKHDVYKFALYVHLIILMCRNAKKYASNMYSYAHVYTKHELNMHISAKKNACVQNMHNMQKYAKCTHIH